MAKLEHTQKVDTERRWFGETGARQPRNRRTGLLLGAKERFTVQEAEKGAGQARGGAGSTGDAGAAGTPDTVTLELGSSRSQL